MKAIKTKESKYIKAILRSFVHDVDEILTLSFKFVDLVEFNFSAGFSLCHSLLHSPLALLHVFVKHLLYYCLSNLDKWNKFLYIYIYIYIYPVSLFNFLTSISHLHFLQFNFLELAVQEYPDEYFKWIWIDLVVVQ